MERHEDVFYYLTVTNENYAQPSLQAGAEADIIKGMYQFARHDLDTSKKRVRLLGSGAILREIVAAGALLAEDWQVASDIWSVTSYSEVAREARATERWNRLHPEQEPKSSHVQRCLAGDAPVIAASDYVRAYSQLIGSYIDARVIALGTDGFGRSDTRAALRRFFEVDRYQITLAALHALAQSGALPRSVVTAAIKRYAIDSDAPASWVT